MDEFGHQGPFISRSDPKHNTNPVFGYGGYILPLEQVRTFTTFFYQLKSNILSHEILRKSVHPATWEKKGSELFNARNITKYPSIREAPGRILNEIRLRNGHIVYFGIEKVDFTSPYVSVQQFSVSGLIRRIDDYCYRNSRQFLLVLDDEEGGRKRIIEAAATAMFGHKPARRLISTPFVVESTHDQAIQCADWLCAILGKLFAYRTHPDMYVDYAWSEKYYGQRIDSAQTDSSLKRVHRNPHRLRIKQRLQRMQSDLDSK